MTRDRIYILGDWVIMQMQNTPEVFQAFQAIWRIGAIAVPINYLVARKKLISYTKTAVSTPSLPRRITWTKSRSRSPNPAL